MASQRFGKMTTAIIFEDENGKERVVERFWEGPDEDGNLLTTFHFLDGTNLKVTTERKEVGYIQAQEPDELAELQSFINKRREEHISSGDMRAAWEMARILEKMKELENRKG